MAVKKEDGLFSAEIVADSIYRGGPRLTTAVLTFSRDMLAELNTHKMVSKNAGSSRAQPAHKIIGRVKTNPNIPVPGKNQAGMQQAETLNEEEMREFISEWLGIRDFLISKVEYLSDKDGLNIHKQTVNRLLEPFMFVSVVVTATDWANMFAQRTDKAAYPPFQKTALLLYRAMQESEPRVLVHPLNELNDERATLQLASGPRIFNAFRYCHLPFWADDEESWAQLNTLTSGKVHKYLEEYDKSKGTTLAETFLPFADFDSRVIKDICAGRAAKVSYENLESGKIDLLNDIRLAIQLRTSRPAHLSPLEHIATPADPSDMVYSLSQLEAYVCDAGYSMQGNLYQHLGVKPKTGELGYCANLKGWRAYRKELYGENITEFTLEEE